MKCPLLLIADHVKKGRYVHEIGDCLKEECAWWDEDLEGCAIKWLTRAVFDLRTVLHNIESKMPHVEQSGR